AKSSGTRLGRGGAHDAAGGRNPARTPHHTTVTEREAALRAGQVRKGQAGRYFGAPSPPTLAKASQVRAPFLHPQLFFAPFGSSPPPSSLQPSISSPPDSLGFLPTPAPRSPQPRRLRPA
uniref:Uncharacterized protein n=1 Tax=Aegilops tauschii subsp. strangulata TaxID=200361 RepID=A0A453M5F1_AEGTS